MEKKQHLQSLNDKTTSSVCCSTGSYRTEVISEKAYFLGKFEISKDYIMKAKKLYYGDAKLLKMPEKLEFKLFLI